MQFRCEWPTLALDLARKEGDTAIVTRTAVPVAFFQEETESLYSRGIATFVYASVGMYMMWHACFVWLMSNSIGEKGVKVWYS